MVTNKAGSNLRFGIRTEMTIEMMIRLFLYFIPLLEFFTAPVSLERSLNNLHII